MTKERLEKIEELIEQLLDIEVALDNLRDEELKCYTKNDAYADCLKEMSDRIGTTHYKARHSLIHTVVQQDILPANK